MAANDPDMHFFSINGCFLGTADYSTNAADTHKGDLVEINTECLFTIASKFKYPSSATRPMAADASFILTAADVKGPCRSNSIT